MSFDAKVYRVLVASPSDVGDERAMIPEVIAEWNSANSTSLKVILLPVKWESDAFPELGDRPQGLINRQIVKDCDLLVGVFWTRIGTDTGTHISGTVEEIEQFVKTGKPAMLYFSNSPVDPDKIDLKQLQELRNFREDMRLNGLSEVYSGIADFRNKFSRQLLYRMKSTLEKQKFVPSAMARGRLVVEKIIKPSNIKKSDEDIQYVIEAIYSTRDSEGWSSISSVGKYLKNFTPFDHKVKGFETITKYLKSVDEFEVKQEKRSERAQGLDSAFVRLKN